MKIIIISVIVFIAVFITTFLGLVVYDIKNLIKNLGNEEE